ncbi:MAG: hypothetical protein PHH16_00580 [Candidatus Gracilibacteria bacterium]|nr:hypothetical protein [Candidatus Gracilibacteria bacterium]
MFIKMKNIGGGAQVANTTVGAPLEETDIYLNDPENNKDPDFAEAKKSLENGDIKDSVVLWEKIVKKDEEAGKFKKDNNTGSIASAKPKINSKIILAQTYVQYGNYYYKEKEYADKAIKTISEMSEDDYGAYGMYFVGYAYEITKRYDDALTWYGKGLKVSSNTDRLNAIFKNQIGHVYDLMGDMNKAYEYYDESYKLNSKNFQSAVNVGRFLVRTNRSQEAIPYFEYALHTSDVALRSEIYYTLSSIELEFGGLKPDIDKSIFYAKESIRSFPDYPMGYVALARGLYMKNDKEYAQEIKDNLSKSMNLNPNGYYAYEISALYEYDNGDFQKSVDLLQKAVHNTGTDMILMDNERGNTQNELSYEMLLLAMIEAAKKDGKIDMHQLGEKFDAIPFGKDFIKFQLKRGNHGILNVFEGINNYISSYN